MCAVVAVERAGNRRLIVCSFALTFVARRRRFLAVISRVHVSKRIDGRLALRADGSRVLQRINDKRANKNRRLLPQPPPLARVCSSYDHIRRLDDDEISRLRRSLPPSLPY